MFLPEVFESRSVFCRFLWSGIIKFRAQIPSVLEFSQLPVHNYIPETVGPPDMIKSNSPICIRFSFRIRL